MIKPASQLIKEAQDACNCISADNAKNMLADNQPCVLLDVREPQEVLASKLNKAINIPRGLLEMKIQDVCPDPSTRILIHCAGGGRASLAAEVLSKMGYLDVHAITEKYAILHKTFND